MDKEFGSKIKITFEELSYKNIKSMLDKWLETIKDYKVIKGYYDIPVCLINGKWHCCESGQEDAIFKNCRIEVKCDEENNSKKDIDEGRLNVDFIYRFKKDELNFINIEEWGKNGRHHESFKDLDFVKSLVGTRCRLIDVREGHEWRGRVVSLFWDGEKHVFDIEGDKDSEESGYLNIWEICYYEKKES